MRKKPKNWLNRLNWKKNNWKNRTEKKPIKILKKTTGLIRFRFYKQKTEKTEPNRNRKNGKKPSQTEKPSQTGFLPKKTKPNRTENDHPYI